ncbi:hypothetical protein [Ottowia sp.]|uniref:hypothetical protein n=1 Tax=Ottowia sp. TaxID=1898956 RepID=UPI002D064DB0|nr:hypothetical protein [Ottowia sp.]HOB66273.1 hypothetical protein [Ottowia sp.]HPZ56829.1 hypothetical protein [Ottowia sp.]HQD48691.1 hypothetical protein [Ottowia sp.]
MVASHALGAAALAAPVISYTVTAPFTAPSGTGGNVSGGAATGLILANGVRIGVWNLTNWNAKELNGNNFSSFNVSPFAANAAAPNNYAGIAGVGLAMFQPSSPAGGATSYGYSVAATLDPGVGYTVAGVTILGRPPGTAFFQGPNSTGSGTFTSSDSKGSLTFSNFGGVATLTNPVVPAVGYANLNAADGSTNNGAVPWTIPDAYRYGDGPYDWKPASVFWKVSSNAGATMTFVTDYGGRGSANEGAAFSFNIVPLSDMTVMLSGFPAQASPGDVVTGTLTCTNAGPGDAVNATCGVDMTKLPAGATLTCNPTSPQATLPAGATISCTVSYVTPATPVTVAANTSAGNEHTTTNNTASVTVGVTPADMAVALSGFPTSVTPGQTVSGTITCLNTGPGTAAAPSCSVAGLPAGATVTCSPDPAPATLPKGSAITCQVSYTAATSQTVAVTGKTNASNDPNAANNEATQTVTVPASDMTVALAGFPANVVTGQTVTGTVTCTNTGPDAAATALCNVNGLPAGATVTCSPTPPQTLAVGGSISCQVSYVAPNPLTTPVTVVGATGAGNDIDTTNNTAWLGGRHGGRPVGLSVHGDGRADGDRQHYLPEQRP